MTITFVFLILTIALFIWGKYRADLVAVLALIALYLFGILDTEQALSGFSNPTVIMLAALFVVGEGLTRSGLSGWMGGRLIRLGGKSELRLMVILLGGTALIGAFISNTGTVAIMMPIMVAAAWQIRGIPSQFLIPLAFVANIGGLLTLVGSPPNIIVSDVLAETGLRAFGFFEFGLIGLPLLLITLLFMVTIGRGLLPLRKALRQPVDLAVLTEHIAADHTLPDQLFLMQVSHDSMLAGKTLVEARLGRDYGVSILKIDHPAVDQGGGLESILQQLQADETIFQPRAHTVIRANDILLVKGQPAAVNKLAADPSIGLEMLDKREINLQEILFTREMGLSEIVIAPRSQYIGQTITGAHFADRYNVQVLNILRQGKEIDLRKSVLEAGDVLLVRATWEQLELYKQESHNFVVIGSPEATSQQVVKLGPASLPAILSLLVMIGLLVTGVVPPVMAALIAAAMMVLGGSLNVKQASDAIVLNNVILLAALLPMSIALQVTGGADLIANGIVSFLGSTSEVFLIAGIFLLTSAITQVISNTAAAVLIAPIALQVALDLNYSPHAFLMAVAVAAATGFLTPFSTPTNLLVMTPGGYRFGDYARVGLPLLILILIASLLLLPVIWPV
jgi:di/tricarboxylate transporter